MRPLFALMTLLPLVLGGAALAQKKQPVYEENPQGAPTQMAPEQLQCVQKCMSANQSCNKACKGNSKCAVACAKETGKCSEDCGFQPPEPPAEK